MFSKLDVFKNFSYLLQGHFSQLLAQRRPGFRQRGLSKLVADADQAAEIDQFFRAGRVLSEAGVVKGCVACEIYLIFSVLTQSFDNFDRFSLMFTFLLSTHFDYTLLVKYAF